ncbi:NADPH-dependent FMN reductase [Porphyromonas sp. COT-108 OH1349]|uniref:NADPH-dependent FMN reductase n=1 Tax=Porphyromonas sp. COT-108 OH1349 TaxID=1537504 RepID=UPI000A9FB159|nr:NAD(P)H-dependent oxidoreductase [Porphyromonas sp. COT-108 OH1349]
MNEVSTKRPIKIVAFSGSTSSTSINRHLVTSVLNQMFGHEVRFLDLNDYEMPIFSEDREKAGYPSQIKAFLEAMDEADAIVCSLAEHNGSYSAAFKNIFDWSSRVRREVFAQKPMLLMSTSPGRLGGANVLAAAKSTFPLYGADVVATFSLPSFGHNFDVESLSITDHTLKAQCSEAVSTLLARLEK